MGPLESRKVYFIDEKSVKNESKIRGFVKSDKDTKLVKLEFVH